MRWKHLNVFRRIVTLGLFNRSHRIRCVAVHPVWTKLFTVARVTVLEVVGGECRQRRVLVHCSTSWRAELGTPPLPGGREGRGRARRFSTVLALRSVHHSRQSLPWQWARQLLVLCRRFFVRYVFSHASTSAVQRRILQVFITRFFLLSINFYF